MRINRPPALVAAATLLVEILIATVFAASGFIRGSLGDLLVVILIYFLVLTFRSVPAPALALGVFLFACLVEAGQSFGLAAMLGFERDGLGALLIGNTFSWGDILMYALGCLAAIGIQRLLPGAGRRRA